MSQKDYLGVSLQRAGVTYLKTARSTVDYYPPISEEDITKNAEELEGEETLGNRAPVAYEYGGRIFSGGISFFCRPNSTPIFASMAWGNPDTSTPAGATTARDHEFDPVAAGKEPNAATLWVVKADPNPAIVDQIVGAKGNELNLEVEANGYLGGSLGVLAPKLIGPISEPAGVTRDTTKRWSFAKVTAEISVNGAALAPIQLTNFSLSYNNNIVEDQFVLGDVEVDDLPVGNIECEVNFTPTRSLETHYRRALMDDPDNVQIKLLAQAAEPFESPAGVDFFNEMEIDVKRALYTEAPANINAGETLRSVEVTAKPVIDDTTSQVIVVRFRNNQTGAKYLAPTS